MGYTALVAPVRRTQQDADFDLAIQVVALLQLAGMKLSVAIWMETPDFEEGRLVLAAPELDRLPLLKAYEAVIHTLKQQQFKHLPPPTLILRMKDPLIRDLRRRLGKSHASEGMRLGGQTIGGQFVNNGYVFHIQ